MPLNGFLRSRLGSSRLRSAERRLSRSSNNSAAPSAIGLPRSWIESPLPLMPSRGLLISKLGMSLEDLSFSPSRGFERSMSGALISGGCGSPDRSSSRLRNVSCVESNRPFPSAAAAAVPPTIAAPPARLMSLALVLTGSTTPLKLIFGGVLVVGVSSGWRGKVPDKSPDRKSPDRKSPEGR